MKRLAGLVMIMAGLAGGVWAETIGFDAKYVVDTSGLAPGNYWLDWYVSPGAAPYTKGTIEVGGVTIAGTGVLLGPGLYGSSLVTGTLNGTPALTISNDFDSLAAPTWLSGDYSHLAALDSSLSFTMHLQYFSPQPGDSGTVVMFSIFTDGGGVPVGTAFDTLRGDGALGQVDYLPGSGFQFTALELTSGGTVMTQQQLGPEPVPEPAMWPLLAGALAFIIYKRRKR